MLNADTEKSVTEPLQSLVDKKEGEVTHKSGMNQLSKVLIVEPSSAISVDSPDRLRNTGGLFAESAQKANLTKTIPRRDAPNKTPMSELGSVLSAMSKTVPRKGTLKARTGRKGQIGRGTMNLKRYVSPNFCKTRKDPIQLEHNDPKSPHHNVQEMV